MRERERKKKQEKTLHRTTKPHLKCAVKHSIQIKLFFSHSIFRKAHLLYTRYNQRKKVHSIQKLSIWLSFFFLFLNPIALQFTFKSSESSNLCVVFVVHFFSVDLNLFSIWSILPFRFAIRLVSVYFFSATCFFFF